MDNRDQPDFQDILITKRLTDDFLRNQGLKKIWTAKYLWALGTGTVMAGMYTQWNPQAESMSPFSILAALGVVTLIYFAFILLVAQLAQHFPYAGGPYAFARRGLGTFGGYLAGTAAVFQFTFGAAALLMIFKGYLLFFVPEKLGLIICTITFIFLLAVHAFDAGISAGMQFLITNCALSGLILFFIGSAGGVNVSFLGESTQHSFCREVIDALPFVIWFYFGLEVLSVTAEETKSPEKTLPLGLMSAVLSASLFCFGVWFFVSRAVPETFFNGSGYPLLSVLQKIQGHDRVLMATFSAVSLCAFLSGLNGFINGYSREIFALSRAGYYLPFLSQLHFTRRTPYMAILIPGSACILISFFGHLKFLVSLSLISALFVHVLILISYFRIRKYEPVLFRFSRLVYHPLFFYLALFLVILLLMVIAAASGGDIWKVLSVWILACIYYFLWARHHIREEAPEESRDVSGEKKIKIDLH